MTNDEVQIRYGASPVHSVRRTPFAHDRAELSGSRLYHRLSTSKVGVAAAFHRNDAEPQLLTQQHTSRVISPMRLEYIFR